MVYVFAHLLSLINQYERRMVNGNVGDTVDGKSFVLEVFVQREIGHTQFGEHKRGNLLTQQKDHLRIQFTCFGLQIRIAFLHLVCRWVTDLVLFERQALYQVGSVEQDGFFKCAFNFSYQGTGTRGWRQGHPVFFLGKGDRR